MGKLYKSRIAFGVLLWLGIAFASGRVAHAVTAQTLAQLLAAVVADRQIFHVTPGTVAERLRSIVELKAGKRTAYSWEFTGSSVEAGLRWARAEFQPSETGRGELWDLVQIQIGLIPIDGDYNALYKALESEIRKRLGKPRGGIRGTEDKRKAWRIAKYWEVSIGDGIFQSPVDKHRDRLILTEVAVLQGEQEN